MKSKFFALSAIAALSLSLAACGDDSSDNNNSTPSGNNPPAEQPDENGAACTETKCAGDVLLVCTNGKVEQKNCATEGKKCSNNACVAAGDGGNGDGGNGDGGNGDGGAKECETTTCDGNVLKVCKDGKVSPTDCAQSGMICKDNSCQDPKICEPNAKVCSGDAKGVQTCSADGMKLSEVEPCNGDAICVKGACQEPEKVAVTVIGNACSCTGNDCTIKISGKELKDALTLDKLSEALGMSDSDSALVGGMVTNLLATIKDDEVIEAPNYFSTSITGCDGLTAPAGMAVGCMYDSTIKFPDGINNLVSLASTLIPTVLELKMVKDKIAESGISLDTIDIAGILSLLQKTLKDGIPFKAKNGACILADIDINLSVADETINKIVNMANVQTLVNKINTPGHDHSKAKAASCPEGSTMLSFDVSEDSEQGSAVVGFDACFKTCSKDDDCRKADGYSCVKLPRNQEEAVAETGDAAWTASVCLDKSNIDFFKKMTDDFNKLLPAD